MTIEDARQIVRSTWLTWFDAAAPADAQRAAGCILTAHAGPTRASEAAHMVARLGWVANGDSVTS